jgi:hypothetical protein
MSHRSHDLRELYSLRERLREQFESGKGEKLQLCLAIAEISQRIMAIEKTRSLPNANIAVPDQQSDR